MDFGFTNDRADLERVIQFRDAAVADGWVMTPTYDFESVDRASHLHKDGFVISILSRDNSEAERNYKYEAQVSIWGPDGMAIKPPQTYDWPTIQAGLRTCNKCGATDVNTERYSFAGRCCAACLPEMRRQHERPGWTS